MFEDITSSIPKLFEHVNIASMRVLLLFLSLKEANIVFEFECLTNKEWHWHGDKDDRLTVANTRSSVKNKN